VARWRAIDGARRRVHVARRHEPAQQRPASRRVSRITRIETPDDATVIVRLRRRYPPFVGQFFTTLQEGAKPILPAHLLAGLPELNDAAYNALPIGSGPFRFVAWDRGQRIVLAANPHYFKGTPRLKRIELTVASDVNTLDDTPEHHAVDCRWELSAALCTIQGSAGISGTANTVVFSIDLALNNARPALRFREVRQAVARAIDYGALIRKRWYGTARRAHDIVPATAIGYRGNPPYRTPPERPTLCSERAGWRRGSDGIRAPSGRRLELTMVIAASGPSQQVGVQLQAMLRRVGIALTLKIIPIVGFSPTTGRSCADVTTWLVREHTLIRSRTTRAGLACDQFARKVRTRFVLRSPRRRTGTSRATVGRSARTRKAVRGSQSHRVR